MKNLTFQLCSVQTKATLFILGCFCLGYFGVQKFNPKPLIAIASGLFISGAIAAPLQIVEFKKKQAKKSNVANL